MSQMDSCHIVIVPSGIGRYQNRMRYILVRLRYLGMFLLDTRNSLLGQFYCQKMYLHSKMRNEVCEWIYIYTVFVVATDEKSKDLPGGH